MPRPIWNITAYSEGVGRFISNHRSYRGGVEGLHRVLNQLAFHPEQNVRQQASMTQLLLCSQERRLRRTRPRETVSLAIADVSYTLKRQQPC